MSFSVLSKSPHFPDSTQDAVEVLVILAAIAILATLLANGWIASAITSVGLVGYLFDNALYIPGAILIALVATVIARIWQDEPLRQAKKFGASPRDIGVIAVGFLLYEFGRTVTEGGYDTAVNNAEQLIRLQQFLGLPDEAHVQEWAFGSSWLVEPFNTVYSYFFLATTVGGLIWLSFNAPRIYRITRNAMGIATFSALAFFALVPMAPPRMVELSGLADSHARVGLSHGYVNQFAAMPSLHVGWMALIGWAIGRAIGGNIGKLVGLVPPVVMMVTVVVTGNHFWLDGVVGAILCVVPAVLLDRIPQLPASEDLPIPSGPASPADASSGLLLLVSGEDTGDPPADARETRRPTSDTPVAAG